MEQYRLYRDHRLNYKNRTEQHMVKWIQNLLKEPTAMDINSVYSVILYELNSYMAANKTHGKCFLTDIMESSSIMGKPSHITRAFYLKVARRSRYALSIDENLFKDREHGYRRVTTVLNGDGRNEQEYYIISYKHSDDSGTDGSRIAFWRSNGKGYTDDLTQAGVYDEWTVLSNIGHYHNGDNVAVPVEELDKLFNKKVVVQANAVSEQLLRKRVRLRVLSEEHLREVISKGKNDASSKKRVQDNSQKK